MLHLAFPNHVLNGPSNIFDRDIGIDAMLEEKIDGVHLQSPQRRLGNRSDMRWPTVDADGPRAAIWVQLIAELRCDHDAIPERKKSFSKQLFIRERSVYLRGIEEGDAIIDRRTQQCDHLVFVGRRTVSPAHSHAAQPNG